MLSHIGSTACLNRGKASTRAYKIKQLTARNDSQKPAWEIDKGQKINIINKAVVILLKLSNLPRNIKHNIAILNIINARMIGSPNPANRA